MLLQFYVLKLHLTHSVQSQVLIRYLVCLQISSILNQTLKPLGFVLATGLHPLVSETATHCFGMPSLRLAPNRLMSFMQELLSECLM
jgi:hypothetical protein